VTLTLVTPDGPKPVATKDYFAGKTVVLFGLPGAFTPTCHKNHLPGFVANEPAFKAKGVDAIAMTSVNDPFVLAAWAEATGAGGHVDFLADGSAVFAKAAGLDLDLTERGLGIRSKRYSALVKDGVVKELNIEPQPGVADLSGAEHILKQIP
jgi:peroxiredoxin